jgi:hypothetical protein
VSDHGSNIHLATQFGCCDFLMPRSSQDFKHSKLMFLSPQEKYKKHKATIPVPNIKARVHSFGYQVIQSSHNIQKPFDIVCCRKSVQRGMAVGQLRGNSNEQEPLVREILSLGEKSLSTADYLKLQSTLTDDTKNIQFVLSNNDEYEKVVWY